MNAIRGRLTNIIKSSVARIHFEKYRRCAEYSIIRNHFATYTKSEKVQRPSNRRKDFFYEYIIDKIGHNTDLCMFEFGVYKGDTIAFFATHFSNDNSIFYGFDSFEGLPDNYEHFLKKGVFSLDGILPSICDDRIQLVKGWFQETLVPFLCKNNYKNHQKIFIHFDADLFSSTLFLLWYDLRYLAKCSTLGQSLLPEFKVIQILLLQGLEHGHDDSTILRTFY